ncbi:MAG: tRNA uridine-5-carboxymethylaminomethyl(34) synthesis GTPase MnmE [Candidatus Cloacimonetes bacterium]|nr:tRNA uridine-5-carboxymethylaminomethyl(34) synthesis GTPase MnmE [Candidatus Cloacimonadota bacterium]
MPKRLTRLKDKSSSKQGSPIQGGTSTGFEPICAVITTLGISAVAMLRVSGSGAIELVAGYFSQAGKLLKAPSHKAIFGIFQDQEKQAVDEVVCILYRAPNSYTGEDTIELCCHGNPHLTQRILQILLGSCRLAKPGEFTLRAFLNGKLDLTQAEAVNDLILAQTSLSETAALAQLKGFLARELKELLTRLTQARLSIELAIDFTDQDLPALDEEEFLLLLQSILARMDELYSDSSQGKILREGFKLCLAGAPNVGKSSVFNAFLRQNRAIVSPHPGTTRDYLEERISLSGLPIVIYDTAGIRETFDDIETQGIERTAQILESSDLVLYLIEPGQAISHPQGNHLVVMNKIDLLGFSDFPDRSAWEQYLALNDFEDVLPCSVVLENGLQALEKAILSRINLPQNLAQKPFITNARHLSALDKARTSLKTAIGTLSKGMGYEFVAFDLIEASSHLESILGVISNEALLNQIFDSFCIGK